MYLTKEYKFAYRIIKENLSLYKIFKRITKESVGPSWVATKEVRLAYCIQRTIGVIAQRPIDSLYTQMKLPKQMIPIIGKKFNVKVYNLLRIEKLPRLYTVTMECTGYDSSRNMLLFGKTGQPIIPERLSMVGDERFDAKEFVINLANTEPEDYILEKKLNLDYLFERYPNLFNKHSLTVLNG